MKQILISILFLGLINCDGSTSNPATENRADLNPPKQLISVTQDGSLKLNWQSFNAEDDFQGFMVFGAKKSIDTLYTLVKYPRTLESASELLSASFPRCADNNAFFLEFGFPESDADCEGINDIEKKAIAPTIASGSGSTLSMVAEDAPLANWLKCTDTGEAYTNANLSVKSPTEVAIGPQSCTVATVFDGGAAVAIENGSVYTYFVMAIMKDDFSKASWVSNVVEDAPSKDIFATASITLKYGDAVNVTDADNAAKTQYVRFALNGATVLTAPTPASCAIDSTKTGNDDKSLGVCSLSGANNMPAADDGIYIGRDGKSTQFEQRIYISTPLLGKIDLQPVGLSKIGTYTGRLPGDEATTSFPTTKGSKFIVNGDQIFDFKVTNADDTVNYGKVIITTVKDATITDNTGDVTFEITIVYQPKTGSTYYLQ